MAPVKKYSQQRSLIIASMLLVTLLQLSHSAWSKPAHPILIAMTDEVRNMCTQAEQLINTQKFGEAEQLLHSAANIDPNCAEVHGYLGMAYQSTSRTQQAIQEYTQALQLNPQMSFIKVNLGTCYMNMNQADQAVPLFQQYLQENPNAPDAVQVNSYIQQAGSRQGQQSLRGTVEAGQALLNQHKYREACNAFQQAIAQQPNFAPAHFFLGYALAQSGQNQKAITEFQASLQYDPSMKEAVLNIGSNYQSLGDCANAITWYERYLHENPSSPKSGDIKQRIHGLRQQLAKSGGSAPQAAGMTPQGANGFAANPQQGFGTAQPAYGSAAQGNGYQSNQAAAGISQDDYFTSACANGRPYRWARMPIRVCIANGAGVPGYRDSFYQDLSDSFSKWAQGSEFRLAFVPVQSPSQAEIVCDWTGDPNKVMDRGQAIEGGLTKLMGQPQQNGDVLIGSAKMTILTNRSGQSLSDDDMKKVCLHEVGHALGINGHSNNNSDVMFFSESPTVWPSLTKRDKATICHLYSSYPRLSNSAQ